MFAFEVEPVRHMAEKLIESFVPVTEVHLGNATSIDVKAMMGSYIEYEDRLL